MGIIASAISVTPMSEPIHSSCLTVNQRNLGIEALRIVAMLMVCVIHFNLFSGILVNPIPAKEYTYYFGTWTESVGLVGVNLYAMITGYVCVSGRWQYRRYVRLWVLVAFYTVLLFVVGYTLSVFGVIPYSCGVESIVKMIAMMGLGSTYWYFAAYTGLFFAIPFLNKCLLYLDKKNFRLLVVVLVLFLPLINFKSGRLIYDEGYNMIWLTVLYIAGAYIRIFPPRALRTGRLLLICVACTLQPLCFVLLGLSPMHSFTWPLTVVYSLALFIVFSRMEISALPLRRLVTVVAPVSFSVYLIHVHPWSWNILSAYSPGICAELGYPVWFSMVAGISLFVVCAIVDFIRMRLFVWLKFNALSDFVAEKIEKFAVRLLQFIRAM